MSRPTVSKAQTSYPIFAASFANSRPGYLVVGGGGGGGRHGIKNKITLFDFSSRAPVVESAAEIEASEDDSVTCLANLATKDGLILYAGINSSEEDRLKDKNEHFRAFELEYPKSTRRAGNNENEKTPQGKIAYMSKTQLFTPPEDTNSKKEAYQRLVRLSPPPRAASNTPSRRIGAITSSLGGDENEIVVFSATSNKPQNPQDIIQRIALKKGQEANDVDIHDQGEGHFQVVYALDYDVHVQDVHYDFGKRKSVGKTDATSRRHIYTVPHPDPAAKKGRPKIRCIRVLSPSHVLLLANKSNRTGAELLVLRLHDDGPGSMVLRKTLPSHIKAAVDMDVALLDADAEGAYQAVVAVAGIDISLIVMTIDYRGQAANSLSGFSSFATYRDVHDVQMTKLVFSPFYKPDSSPGKTPPPQYLRLASTSLGNSIDVETFELQSLTSKPRSRYVLQTARSRRVTQAAYYLVFAAFVAMLAFMIQSLIDPQGQLTKDIVPEALRNAVSEIKAPGAVVDEASRRADLEGMTAPVAETSHRIRDLLHLHLPHVLSSSSDDDSESQTPPSPPQKALVIHHDPDTDGSLSTEVHPDTEAVLERHVEAKRWEELSPEQKSRWREKMVQARVWAAEEGEGILKGIFFSEMRGLVGRGVAGVAG